MATRQNRPPSEPGSRARVVKKVRYMTRKTAGRMLQKFLCLQGFHRSIRLTSRTRYTLQRDSLAPLRSPIRSTSSCSVRSIHRSVSYGTTQNSVSGSTIYITWSDRQNVIRTHGFDIIDDLPHFLLVLLIIQRFDLARWGFFTEFHGSSIQRVRENHQVYILKATFKGSTAIIFPYDDPVHSGINLAGRSTGAAGARLGDGGEKSINSKDVRKDNDLIAKFSWPEETRLSEVDVIKKAMEIAESNDLVKNHIPTMLGDLDPPYITCSTSIIRTFLDLDVTGARVLRVILFRRLKEIKYLDEEDMLIAFLDCFFCKFLPVVSPSPRGTHSGQVIGLYGSRSTRSNREISAWET